MAQPAVTDKKRVLILCTGNSARSQMAEGLLRHDAGDSLRCLERRNKTRPPSSGGNRGHARTRHRHSSHRSKHVDEFRGQPFDHVLTVCDSAKESCPTFPGTITLHHAFDDPALAQASEAERLAIFRRGRDEIREYLRTLWSRATPC